MRFMHRTAATAAVAGMLLTGGMAAPSFAAHNDQDGLVNVNVEGNEILNDNNVAIGLAAQIAANVCGVKVGPLAVLGTAVDRSGDTRTVCENEQGDQRVIFTQN